MSLKLAIDFDGTLCLHRYPNIGEPLVEGIEWLKQLRSRGAKLFLDTMRSGKELEEAINWCKSYGLEFDSIGPEASQMRWTSSPKCHADYGIDDRSNLDVLYDDLNRAYINWDSLIPKFENRLRKEGWL